LLQVVTLLFNMNDATKGGPPVKQDAISVRSNEASPAAAAAAAAAAASLETEGLLTRTMSGSNEVLVKQKEHHAESETSPDADTEEKESKIKSDIDEQPVSKNSLKRKKRYEKMMLIKKRKKEQDKETKAAKAKAEGRDLDEERRICAENTLNGEGKRLRQLMWEQTRLPLTLKSFQVCLDCSFGSSMTAKEITSLASQIVYCHATNKRSDHPCTLAATSVEGGTLDHLQNISGWQEWHKRAFTFTSQPLEEYHKDHLDRVVYLTSDSETTLSDLDDSKIYIIGGIVDRNRLKRAAIDRAETLGVATAKLPIDEYLKKMEATRVLTCNHVFEILLKYRENGRDWQQALLDVLPKKKGAKALEDDKGANEEGKVEADS
jgi:tRNA (guanine9-N1)-methyltransferase